MIDIMNKISKLRLKNTLINKFILFNILIV